MVATTAATTSMLTTSVSVASAGAVASLSSVVMVMRGGAEGAVVLVEQAVERSVDVGLAAGERHRGVIGAIAPRRERQVGEDGPTEQVRVPLVAVSVTVRSFGSSTSETEIECGVRNSKVRVPFAVTVCVSAGTSLTGASLTAVRVMVWVTGVAEAGPVVEREYDVAGGGDVEIVRRAAIAEGADQVLHHRRRREARQVHGHGRTARKGIECEQSDQVARIDEVERTSTIVCQRESRAAAQHDLVAGLRGGSRHLDREAAAGEIRRKIGVGDRAGRQQLRDGTVLGVGRRDRRIRRQAPARRSPR